MNRPNPGSAEKTITCPECGGRGMLQPDPATSDRIRCPGCSSRGIVSAGRAESIRARLAQAARR